MLIYGIIDQNNCLIDISKSLKGCKRYATQNGYNKIGYRNVMSYNAVVSHKKVGLKRVEFRPQKRIKNRKMKIATSPTKERLSMNTTIQPIVS